MGIKTARMVYALLHTHKFAKKSQCTHGHKDVKLIGIFSSRQLADENEKRYKNLEGFRDFQNAFQILEYQMDHLDTGLIEQICNRVKTGNFE